MIIQKAAVGNHEEAFIQYSFSEDLNVISSDDNNKGKTILIQTIMYCLGNIPAFPVSFDYNSYYHYVEFSVEDKNYILCRKNDTFILKECTTLMIFNGISELKRYWNKHIFSLPKIPKAGLLRIVDPELFLQLFFIGQDKKDTSNIANKGYYKKDDFINMLYSIMNLESSQTQADDVELTKTKINSIKDERKALLKEHKVLKSSKKVNSYLSAISDKIAFESKIKEIEKVKEKIIELRKARNASINRKLKCEVSLKELVSLNRAIDHGEIRCMDCNSTHIGFKSESKASCSFDISTPELRQEIIGSINEKIAAYTEDIQRLTLDINHQQKYIQSLLDNDEITLETIVAYKKDIIDAAEAEKSIIKIDNEIEQLEQSLKMSKQELSDLAQKQHDLIQSIVDEMNTVYKLVDPTGNLFFDNLFTIKGKVYSGSEATIFHLVKLYALAKVINHNYPIVVDSFRAEDLSTPKENIVIELFSRLKSQIIFTTTLKAQEEGKYNHNTKIHHIDYAGHTPSKMLNKSYLDDFIELMDQLALTIS